MTNITSYLSFGGNCREAMEFYKDLFGGELTIDIIEGSPVAEHFPPEAAKHVLHSMLVSGGLVLMGSDMAGPDGVKDGNSVSMMLGCTSEEEITRFYTKLSEGGNVGCPLGPSFWGSIFAQVTDKFGKKWLLNYDKSAIA